MNHRSLTTITLLALASALTAQDENWRAFGIQLQSRPTGSTAAFTVETAVGSPAGFDSNWTTQPGTTPFAPESLSQSWSLSPSKEYQVLFVDGCVCTGGFQPNISIGQRLVLDLSATFSQPGAVTIGACGGGFEAACGNLFISYPPPFFYYQSACNQLPWADAAQGSDNGNSVQCNASLDYSSAVGVLQFSATSDVASYQDVPPPPPWQGFGLFWARPTVNFTVSQAITVDLAVSSFGPVRGETQFFPVLPITQPNGFYGRSSWWYDPPMAVGYDFEMTGTSLFTDILTLPVGIDTDGQFEVLVGGVSLGWFAEGSRVDFRQLLGGNGVPSFRIVGIDPVDSTDATAFPIQLAFDTAEAGFTMTALPWRKVGSSCGAAGGCPTCQQMSLSPIGDALEGNLNFALGIDHAPGGGVAAVYLALGPASTTPVPLFCGQVVLPLSGPIYTAGVTTLVGAASCGGAGSVPLPLPAQPSLVGVMVTAQALTLCPGGGLGLTHGIEFAIGN